MKGYKIRNQNNLHFLTMTVVDWLDVFTRWQYKDLIVESIKYCQAEKGLVICAYVIMSNHLHLIAYAKDGFKLSNTVRDFKKFTAKKIIATIQANKRESRRRWLMEYFRSNGEQNENNKTFQFWIQDNHPIELISPKWINQKLNYIHLNPVRSKIVDRPEAYWYSSARQYLGEQGVIEIELLDFGVSEGYIML